MPRRLLLLLGLLAGVLSFASAANAERRVALVVGNSAYTHAATLRNPRNDASAISETLKQLGFDVLVGIDLDQEKFASIIQKFERMLDDADVALFFYAGHGLQINGKNYLVSTNAKLENEFLIPAETIELDTLIHLMEAKAPIDLVFLDACRNNPLTDDLKRSLGAMKRSASLGRGLARIEPTGRDTLIAFAAAPGQEAADGSDRNSPFTGALLKYMPKPGLEVSVMLKEVAADVRRETKNTQRPQQLSDMTRTFYFAKAEPAAVMSSTIVTPPAQVNTQALAPRPEMELAYWTSVRALQDCSAVQAYINRYPNGTFVELAKLDEGRLCATGRKVTIVDAPSPAPSPAVVQAAAPAAPVAAAPAAPATIVRVDLGTPAPMTSSPPPKTKVASLPEPQDPLPGPQDAQPEPKEMTMTDVIRNVQRELIRLGCATGEADGNWNARGREAVVRYNKKTGATLIPDAPSIDMAATLHEQKDHICPLECERGYRIHDNACVAIKSASGGRRGTRGR